jgi:hypothetical protein
MSRISSDRLVSGDSAVVAAANATDDLGAILAVTFSTDAPAASATDKTITVADGDASGVTGANASDLAREAVGAFAHIRYAFNELLAQLRAKGLEGAHSAPTLPTLLTVVYTTDAPSITPDAALSIADGDATLVRSEYNNAAEEFEGALLTVKNKHNALLTALKNYASGTSQVADLGTLLTITYGTDDPATTADGAVTIADGDAATAAVGSTLELYDEIEAGLATVKTAYNQLLDALQLRGVVRA